MWVFTGVSPTANSYFSCCHRSSVVEYFLGTKEVASSILAFGSIMTSNAEEFFKRLEIERYIPDGFPDSDWIEGVCPFNNGSCSKGVVRFRWWRLKDDNFTTIFVIESVEIHYCDVERQHTERKPQTKEGFHKSVLIEEEFFNFIAKGVKDPVKYFGFYWVPFDWGFDEIYFPENASTVKELTSTIGFQSMAMINSSVTSLYFRDIVKYKKWE